MACELHVFQVSATNAPATYEQTITFNDGSFLPKACICLGAMQSSINTKERDAVWSRGFWAEGDQQHCFVGQKNDDDTGNGEAHRENESDRVHIKYNASGSSVKKEFQIKSIVAGTCTLQMEISNTSAGEYFLFFFIDAEEACVGTALTKASIGADTITHGNLDFTPNCIFFAGDSNASLDDHDADDTFGWFGFSDGSNDLAISWFGNDNAAGMSSQLNQSNALFMRDGALAQGTRIAASLTSFGSSQFVVDYSTVPDTQKYFMFLALKINNVYVGNNEASSTSTSVDQTISGVGFQPQGVMFLSGNNTSFDADKESGSDDEIGITQGCATDENDNAGFGISGTEDDESVWRRTDNNDSFRTIAPNGDTAENSGRVTDDSWGSDGFDIDWATASAKKFGFIALSNEAAAGATAPVLGRARFQPALTRDVQRLRGFRNT